MSAPDPTRDVLYVSRALLPSLPTADDPAAVLLAQVPPPFHGLGGQAVSGEGVAITVLSMLDEPVEAIGAYTTKGTLIGRPQVRVDGQELPPPSVAADLGGHTGFGWIDPSGFDDLVSVGTWVSQDVVPGSSGPYVGADLVVHLRCNVSKVDILIGGLANWRFLPGAGLGGDNPYHVTLYEPGVLAEHPPDSVYDDFCTTSVIDQGTTADTAGTSAAGTVSFLARAPKGRQDELWHILLMLGPHPIAGSWTDPPPPNTRDDPRWSTDPPTQPTWTQPPVDPTRRAADIEDWVNRLLVVSSEADPDDAAKRRIQLATNDIPTDLIGPVLTEYARRLRG